MSENKNEDTIQGEIETFLKNTIVVPLKEEISNQKDCFENLSDKLDTNKRLLIEQKKIVQEQLDTIIEETKKTLKENYLAKEKIIDIKIKKLNKVVIISSIINFFLVCCLIIGVSLIK